MNRLAGLSAVAAMLLSGTAFATTVYPIDRAEILSGAKFDFKVEFDTPLTAKDVKVTING